MGAAARKGGRMITVYFGMATRHGMCYNIVRYDAGPRRSGHLSVSVFEKHGISWTYGIRKDISGIGEW